MYAPPLAGSGSKASSFDHTQLPQINPHWSFYMKALAVSNSGGISRKHSAKPPAAPDWYTTEKAMAALKSLKIHGPWTTCKKNL